MQIDGQSLRVHFFYHLDYVFLGGLCMLVFGFCRSIVACAVGTLIISGKFDGPKVRFWAWIDPWEVGSSLENVLSETTLYLRVVINLILDLIFYFQNYFGAFFSPSFSYHLPYYKRYSSHGKVDIGLTNFFQVL